MQLAQKLLSTRGGTVALGGVAALMAGFVLLLYLNQYRSSVNANSEPVTVLVAKTLIEKGMPGDSWATPAKPGPRRASASRSQRWSQPWNEPATTAPPVIARPGVRPATSSD